MNEAKDTSYWTLNEEGPSWNDLDLGMIDINDLRDDVKEKVLPVPETKDDKWWVKEKKAPRTDALDKWIKQQENKGSGVRVLVMVIIMMAMILAAGSFFVANAQAGMAFLRFEVVSVSADTITVRDEHGDVFDFWKEHSPVCTVGQNVIVATDLVYSGDSTWKMDRGRTSLIAVED